MKLEALSKEQEAQMIEFREKWRKKALTTDRVDKEKTKEAITTMYRLIGKEPPIFIFCPSLLFAQFQINYCREVLPLIFEKKANLGDNLWANLRDNLGDNLWANLRANLGDNLWANLRANLGDNLWANLRANLGDNLRANLRDNLGDNLRANLWDNLGDNLRANLRDNLGDNLGDNLRDNLWAKLKFETTYTWGNMDAYWIAFYEFPEKFLGIKYSPTDSQKLKIWSILSQSCSWFWCYENYCFISDRPTKYAFDSNYRLHCVDGPAIKFIDGWELYYIHGREVPKWVFDKAAAGEITKDIFLKEQNSDIKGGIYEVLGQKKMMDLLGAKEIDARTIVHKNGDVETVTLLKTKEKFPEIDNMPFAWVKMVCPSTGTQYLQGVEPHHTNAIEAIASLSPFKAEEYSFDLRS